LIYVLQALNIDKTNVKALWRRATARIEMNDFDEAVEDLTAARKIDPQNPEVAAAYSRAVQAKEALVRKTKAAYAKMFSSE